jgi:transcriptional regulator with XRE-family HTH domain
MPDEKKNREIVEDIIEDEDECGSINDIDQVLDYDIDDDEYPQSSLREDFREIRADLLKGLGNRVVKVRERLGFKQQKRFAVNIGMSASYISDIEKGKTRPSFNLLVGLLRRYRVNLSWLLIGKGPMFIEKVLPGRKICEYDLGDQGDFMHRIMGYMEKSKFCRNVIMSAIMRAYYENESIIKKDLEELKIKDNE